MPNLTISDLPLAILPLDGPNSFFEVQTTEGGVAVSRKVASDNIVITVSSPSLTGTISDAIDLLDTIVAGRFGALDPDAAPHVEIDFAAIQAKSNFSTVSLLTLQPVGGEVALGSVALTVAAGAGGLTVNNTLTGVGFERVLTVSDIGGGGGSLAGLSDVDITGVATGDILYKSAGDWLDTGAVSVDPAGAVNLDFNGALTLFTSVNGATIRDTSAALPVLRAQDSSGTELGQLQFNNTLFGLVLNSAIVSGLVTLTSLDSSSVLSILAQGNPDGAFDTYFDNELKTRTTASGIDVLGNSSFDRTLLSLYDTAGTTNVGGLIWNGPAFGDEIDLRGAIPGGEVIITQVDAAGIVPKIHLRAVSDGATELSFNNSVRVATTTTGINVLGSLNNDPTTGGIQDAQLNFSNSGGTEIGDIAWLSSANLSIRNLVHGGLLELRGQNTGGTNRTGLVFDPDNGIVLSHVDVQMARTAIATNGGLEVNNTVTGAGFERALTTSDLLQGGVKVAAQNVANSTVLVDATDLSAPLQPSASYILEATLVFLGNGATANGFRWGLDFNGQLVNLDTVFGGSFSWQNSNGVESIVDASASGASQIKTTFDAAGVSETVKISLGIITQSDYVAGTNVDIQFAQGTSNATNTTLDEGSTLKVTRIA